MITRATLIWAVLAIAAGFGLFQVSYRVASLEEEMNKVNRQIVRSATAPCPAGGLELCQSVMTGRSGAPPPAAAAAGVDR
jgi:hypothetical protein